MPRSRGAVWPVLLAAYIAARKRGRPAERDPSEWCFNLVLDERVARREFSTPRGFLFAREALTASVLSGQEYYRTLLGSASWLREEIPRLHALRAGDGAPPPPQERPAPLLVRMLNAALFPWLSAYLHMVALVRNHRLRENGQPDRAFRISAHPGRLSYETARFDRLADRYRPADAMHRRAEGR